MQMLFNISAFTHEGTHRPQNQDRILVNGQLGDKGFFDIAEAALSVCFVADGVGGNRAGEYAATYILEALKNTDKIHTFEANTLEQHLQGINRNLIDSTTDNPLLKGSASTLTGVIITETSFNIIHAGDSELWLLRNGIIFKITNDMVLEQNTENSPITSYFGGQQQSLSFQQEYSINAIETGDTLMLCTDGLLKSLPIKHVKRILLSELPLRTKAGQVYDDALNKGASDNISTILIERIQ